MTRRVVVTGLGVVSALGAGREAHWDGLREGRNGISEIQTFDHEGLSIKIAGEARDFAGDALFSRSELTLYDRVTQMAVHAGREAAAQAGITRLEGDAAARGAVVIGSSMGGMRTLDDSFRAVYRENRTRIHPFTVPKQMPNAPASHLSMLFGLTGPAYAVTTACASSNHAIGQAFHMVRSGMADLAFAGGAEAGLTFGVLKAWEGLRVMSKEACRPFCATRNGMVQGEGSAIYVMEPLDHALARGATPLVEIVGFGMTADAGDIVQPSLEGASRAMANALADGGLAPEQVGYINAHGTATAANDKTEIAAIKKVFGLSAKDLVVSSTKSMHGHAIGAAGSLELAAAMLAVREGIAPPTINYLKPDPDCDLDVAPNAPKRGDYEAALSNSFAFGGLNAVLALKAWRG